MAGVVLSSRRRPGSSSTAAVVGNRLQEVSPLYAFSAARKQALLFIVWVEREGGREGGGEVGKVLWGHKEREREGERERERER